MSRGHNPLFWMMACTVPAAGHALGLGEIHVDSALNEPLAAEIDIVGAEPDELVGLIATVANRETFAHFGAERPSFLNNTTFKVTKDARGKPILAIRSSESFTEPLIDFVVDLRWRNGQLIRQYSLLLDPAGYPSATQMATALPVPPSALPTPVVTAPVVAAPVATSHVVTPAATPSTVTPSTAIPSATTPAASSASSTVASNAAAGNAAPAAEQPTQITVGARATLRGIAGRLGAHSDSALNQMMIAIFRANPSAFNGNINRLRLGATLKIPTAQEVAAISHTEANREARAQMQAWRGGTQHSFANSVSAAQSTASAPSVASTASTATQPASATTTGATPADSLSSPTEVAAAASSDPTNEKAALESKILSLEGSLQDIQAQLQAQQDKLLSMQAQARYAEQHPKVVVAPASGTGGDRGLLYAALAGMAVLAAACVALLVRLRRRAGSSDLPSIEKVPVVGPIEAMAPPAPVAKLKPTPASAFAPEASRIEVHEATIERRAEARPETPRVHHEPMESSLELSSGDTAGINAAKLREELAAAKLREEIAAAWALPAAETYKREDIDHESTLAEDIAKSLEDTLKLEAAMTGNDSDTLDTLQNFAYKEPATHDPNETLVGVTGETASFAVSENVPDATMKMTPEDFPADIDPKHLDFNFMELDDTHDTVNMKGNADDTTKSATDKIKVTGEIKAAAEKPELGADDPKLSPHDPDLANCA